MSNLVEAIKAFLRKLLGFEIAHGKPLPPKVENLCLHPDLLALHILKTSELRNLNNGD